jgi:hypothetical protein
MQTLILQKEISSFTREYKKSARSVRSANLSLFTDLSRPTALPAGERTAGRDAATLLSDLVTRGIEVTLATNDRLVARPKSLLNDRDRANLREAKLSVLEHLHALQEQAEIERLKCFDAGLPHPLHPAHCIVRICRSYGVALRIDADDALVVGKAGAKVDQATQPWPTLLLAIQTHHEAVARLVEAGWHLRADFSRAAAA